MREKLFYVPDDEYRYLVTGETAFVTQAIQYASKGFYYYVFSRIPNKKDPLKIDERILTKYNIRTRRWQRKSRNRGEGAAIHYLRYDRTILMMLTEGVHDDFYESHRGYVRDLRRSVKSNYAAMKLFGYSIHSVRCPEEKRRVLRISIDHETYRKTRDHLVKCAAMHAYRDVERMEREIFRLPFQPYDKVHEQLVEICKAVNKARRRRGFAEISLKCIRSFRQPRKIFAQRFEWEGELEELAAARPARRQVRAAA